MKALLINEAEANLASLYPHYKGFWDGWVVARLKRDIRSRGATVGRKGDFVLLDPESFTYEDSPAVLEGWHAAGFVTVYLPGHYINGGCNTSIRAKEVEVV